MNCPQDQQNELFIGPTTGSIILGSNRGVFTSKRVSKGSILCLYKGISISSAYLRFSDYDISNVCSVSFSNFLLDKDPSSIGYANYVQYTLDPTKVNCEFRRTFEDGYVALYSIKDILAGEELFVYLDKTLWIYLFRSSWNSNTFTPIQKQVLHLYDIDINYARMISNEYSISNLIDSKIHSFTDWKFGTINSVSNLPNLNRSCYIASVIQVLSHIPALSRILIETDIIGKDLDPNSFLFRYIKFLKIFLHKQKPNPQVLESAYSYLTENRQSIDSSFVLDEDQDCQEFLTALLNKFQDECSSFEYVNHHLFSNYVHVRTDVNDCGHYAVTSNVEQLLQLGFDFRHFSEKEMKSKALKTFILEDMIATDCKREIEYTCPGCPECKTKKQSIQTRVFHKYPRILIIQLKRNAFDSKGEQILLRDNVIYKRYMTLPEGEDKSVF